MDIVNTGLDVLKTVAPWLSAALTGGPVGVATLAAAKLTDVLGVGSAAALKLVTLTPEQQLALRDADNAFQLDMKSLGYKHIEQIINFDVQQIQIVNTTIQAELANSQKEAWYQKAWRPANGFCVAGGSFIGIIAMSFLGWQAIVAHDSTAIGAIPAIATAIAAILAVPGAAVGITAWHRGVLQREQAASSSSSEGN